MPLKILVTMCIKANFFVYVTQALKICDKFWNKFFAYKDAIKRFNDVNT